MTAPKLLVVGGYGVVGLQFCEMFHRRNPEIRLLIAGRSPEKAQHAAARFAGAEGIGMDVNVSDPLQTLVDQPDAIIIAVNDTHDHLIRSAILRHIPIADIARWTDRLTDAEDLATKLQATAPVVLASGWMAGAVASVINAKLAAQPLVRQIDIDVLFYAADKSGPDSVAGFIDMHRPFHIYENGHQYEVKSLTDRRKRQFPSGIIAKPGRFSAPDQYTLVKSGLAHGVAMRMAFDDPVTTTVFAGLVRSGIWGVLPRSARARLLHNPGAGARHEILITAKTDYGLIEANITDPLGQTHLTAAGAVCQAERLLGTRNRNTPAPGISFPEQASDAAADLATLTDLGVSIDGC